MSQQIILNQERLYDVSPILLLVVDGLTSVGEGIDFRLLTVGDSIIGHRVKDGVAFLDMDMDSFMKVDTVLTLAQVNRDSLVFSDEQMMLIECRGRKRYSVVEQDGKIIVPVNDLPEGESIGLYAKARKIELIPFDHNKSGRDNFNWSALYLRYFFGSFVSVVDGPTSESVRRMAKNIIIAANLYPDDDGDYILSLDQRKVSNNPRLASWLCKSKGNAWASMLGDTVDAISVIGMSTDQHALARLLTNLSDTVYGVSYTVSGHGDVDTDDSGDDVELSEENEMAAL